MSDPSPRLYLTAPAEATPEEAAALVARALATGHVACVRLALASDDEAVWTRAANHLLAVCHDADTPLIIKDHFRLVAPLGLDGVHLADSRVSLRDLRKSLGPERIIGAYAGASRHRAMTLAEAGADYVSLGPVHAPHGLGDDEEAEAALFAWWAEMIEVPSVAEGGIAPADAAGLAASADFILPEITDWPNIEKQLAAFAAALDAG